MTHTLNAIIASLVVSGASIWGAHPSWAQVDAGSRIRVTTPHGSHRGRLISLDGDSLRYTRSIRPG